MTITPTAVTVTTYTDLPRDLFDDCWLMYEAAFTPLARLAAQRHLMTMAEFLTVVRDPRITKYVATNPDGTVVGMSTLTNQLAAWPLISVPYFSHNWPEPYARGRIWYLGFACVTHPRHDGPAFEQLITRMAVGPRAAHGMVFMDFCTANVLRLIPGIRRTVARLDPEHTFQVYDRQEFWGFDFTPGQPS